MSQFQLIVIGIMMALVLMAVLILSGVIPGFSLGGGGEEAVSLTMWGTIPYEQIKDLLTLFNDRNLKFFKIDYIPKNAATYENELVDALASNRGPDIWFLPQDLILKHKDKIFLIPFEFFSERAFKDIFIEEGELYLFEDGIVALPFVIDPIVLYWNRDLLAAAGFSRPPKNWDEFVSYAQKLTSRDQNGNIIQSGAALGEFQNVDHAKEIISLLILQTGNPIVDVNTLDSTLSQTQGAVIQPAENAVRFFTEFSNPAKTTYSWNRSLAGSKNAFIAGTLAMYFGYSGEYDDISLKNPHLNFDVAEIPQIKDSKLRVTFGRMEALAVSKSSKNINKAALAVAGLIEKDALPNLLKNIFLPPVRRDLLAEPAKDPVLDVFYKSAISSRAWLEPDPVAVSDMFKAMIDSILSGRKKISDAVRDVDIKLDAMLKIWQK